MSQSEGSKPKQQKPKRELLIRFGKMGLLGWFEHHESEISRTKTHVVIKTSRGLELGEVVGPHCYQKGHFRLTNQQVDDYYPNKTKDYPLTEGGTVVRYATEEDLMESKHLEASAKEEAKTCQKFINDMNLPMKVVDAEHLFGGERIIIYFSSNGRVDFRELVRMLAKEYQTRIELRQIGSRDEARLISDLESCGQECCCKRFLKILDPVNMRMAKLQKATLDPSKISGHCGRLKCCLRYEDETYKNLKHRLPKKNSWVKTPKGVAKVIDTQILTQLVVVQDSKNNREAFGLEFISPADPPTVDSDKLEIREETPAEEIPDLTEPIESAIKNADNTEPEDLVDEEIDLDKEIESLSKDLKAETESSRSDSDKNGSGDNQSNADSSEISAKQQEKPDPGKKETDKGEPDKQQSRRPRKNRRNRRKNRQNKKPQQEGGGNNQSNNKNNNNRNKNRRKNRRSNRNKPGGESRKDNPPNNSSSNKDNQ